MANLTNKNGTNDVDVLTLTAKGTYHANGGNDTINIKGGSIVVYTDSGNNIVKITGGSGHTVKVAEKDADSDKINGVEALTVSGADIVDAYLGSGKDTIELSNTNGKKAGGALSKIHGGAWGDTFTVKEGTQGYQLYGDNGDDTFYIEAGSNMIFWGGAANDTFNVTGGINNKIYGGDSNDTFNISTPEQTLILGYGKDTVNVTYGAYQKIVANLGINEINLRAGWYHEVTADIDKVASAKAGKDVGYGVDNLYINGAAGVKAHLGDGKDSVKVYTGSKHQIYTEGWGDTLEVGNGVTESYFDTGAADDTITIIGSQKNTFNAGSGNDTVSVKLDSSDTKYCDIYLGTGNDKLTTDAYAGLVYSKISGGAGDDEIWINSWYAKNNVIYGGSGNDKIGYVNMSTEPNGRSILYGGTGNDVLYSTGSHNLLIGGAGEDGYAIGGYAATYVDAKTDSTGKEDELILFSCTYLKDDGSNVAFAYDEKNDIMRVKYEYGVASYIEGFSLLTKVSATKGTNLAQENIVSLGTSAEIIASLTSAQIGFNHSNVRSSFGVTNMDTLESYTTLEQFYAKESDFKIVGNK